MVQHMLLLDTTNDVYILFLSMIISDKTLGSVYTVDMNKSMSSFTLDSTIFGVFIGSPGEAPNKIRAVGTPGYIFTDGFDKTNSCM